MPLDRDQAADAEQARLAARVRAHGVPRRDAVVDDLEVLLVEALGLGEVVREPLRDRDVDVGERADRAVGEPEPAALAELVEAVLRGEPQRHPRDRPGELAVDVGVDEVRVQDRGRCASEVRDDLAERDRVDVGAQPDVVERHAARLESLARTPRRPARPRAASGSGRPTRARAGRGGAGAGAPPSRRCRRPSACGGRRRPSCRPPPRRGCRAPTTRPSGSPRRARGAGAERLPLVGARAASARIRSASSSGSSRRSAAPASSSESKIGLEASTGGTPPRPRRRPCRARRRACCSRARRASREGRELGSRDGVAEHDPPVEPELGDELLELRAVVRSSSESAGPWTSELDVVAGERRPRRARRRGPSPSSSGRARAAACPPPRAGGRTGTRRGRSRGRSRAASVEGSGNERSSTDVTAVEARSAACRSRLARQCVNQRTSGTPSGRTSGAARTA